MCECVCYNCVYVCMYVCMYVCVCVWGGLVLMYELCPCTLGCGDPQAIVGLTQLLSTWYILKQGLSLNLELTTLANLTIQLAPGVHLCHHHWNYGRVRPFQVFVNPADLTSAP